MDDIRLVLRDNIKFFRKQKGLTQEKLAEACDVTTPYLGDVETGRRYISLQLVETLSRVFEIEPWRLFLPLSRQEETMNMLLADELRESLSKAIDDTLNRFH